MDKSEVSQAAATLGRKGGSVKSVAKAEAVRKNGAKGGRPSGQLVAQWSGDIKVGIWDNETWMLRLYPDRAILKYPTVRWVNNQGGLEHRATRIEGKVHAQLLKVIEQETQDAEDYTERIRDLVWDFID